jgi:predicted nucleic acid-binding protein
LSVDQRYWDSDCFLGWLQGESDKEAHCKEVLTAADDGKILIVTSALTIAEVLALKGKQRIPQSQKAKVEEFFKSEYIVVRNITRRIAEAARSYVWDFGVDPKDALHVATAVDAGLALLNTFDKNLIKKTGKIGPAPLIIAVPSWSEPKLPMDLPPEKKPKKH